MANNPVIFPYIVTLADTEMIVAGFMVSQDAIDYGCNLSNLTHTDCHIWENGKYIVNCRAGHYGFV